MTTEKSARAWFEMLKEPFRSQAIKASEEQPDYRYKKEVYKSLHDAIVCEFKWSKTALADSWIHVFRSIRDFETTYLADPPKS